MIIGFFVIVSGLGWFFCTIMFILGTINPKIALIPFAKKGRKQVFQSWLLSGLACFIILSIISFVNPVEQTYRQVHL